MTTPTTVSTCTVETEQGTHIFEIFDYSKLKGMGNEEFVRSGTFSIGGYDWAIRFYPDGFKDSSTGYISVYLELMSKDTKARAGCDLSLTGNFMNRSNFEASPYLRDDHLTIHCITTVRKPPRVSAPELLKDIKAPASNIAEQLGHLLDAEEGVDVTFSVDGETFVAHKILLAARSPVFKAELFGAMKEAKEQLVTIQDMQPVVFKALLHFIYTDSLPHMDGREGNGNHKDMLQHLLVAADRYAVDRMKVVCESMLCKDLDAENVSDILALAYQHNCDRLKDKCLEFITSSSSVMDSVMATQGYKNLKATCPTVLADAFEKFMRSRSA
ncbi:hypothetical protein U9M48_040362 [Paspalum notatum var. saurae]|uniref:BTB/POZ/MATH-domains containing protein n=1 Tax=Paspalum notatum var. saurae TaxID=547442 RepID=A0AAQ3UQC7_PASNO